MGHPPLIPFCAAYLCYLTHHLSGKHRGNADSGRRGPSVELCQAGCRELSLLVFGHNEGAVELYTRNGFGTIGRVPDVPHKLIRYSGEVLLVTPTA